MEHTKDIKMSVLEFGSSVTLLLQRNLLFSERLAQPMGSEHSSRGGFALCVLDSAEQ